MSTDLTRPDRGEALARLTGVVRDLPADEVGPYLLVVCTILATSAPDVLVFLMDRADERLAVAGADDG